MAAPGQKEPIGCVQGIRDDSLRHPDSTAFKAEYWSKELELLIRGAAEIRAYIPELSFFVVYVQGS